MPGHADTELSLFSAYMDSGDEALRTPASGDHDLSWSRTVERELVHRVSVAEVLLTDVRACGGDRFEAAASWPRSHPTFPRGRDDRHSPLILLETMRQLGIYIPLKHYGVSTAGHFLIEDMSFTIDPAREPRADYGSSEITCRASAVNVRTGSGGVPRGMRLQVQFLADGVPFASAEGGARFVDAVEYAVFRARARETAGPAGSTRRPDHAALHVATPGDVVIGFDGDALVLDPADPRHPFLFDHGADHISGMALLEAARQAAALRSEGQLVRPLACQLRALRFTEHAPSALIECAVYTRTCVFRFRQGDGHTAVGVLRYG